MNRLFLRFFVLVMLAITVASFAVYFAVTRLFGDPLEQVALRQSSGEIFLLEEFVDKAPADDWLHRLNRVREISKSEFELIPLERAIDGMDAEHRIRLMQGGIVINIEQKSLMRRVDLNDSRYAGSSEDVIQVHNLPIAVGVEFRVEALRYLIVALFLLIPIAFWSRAHWRGLQHLSEVANAFGEGKLSIRAKVPEKASIFPLAQCMNDMAGRIEELLEAHRTLLHSVSHELRTPISRLEFGLELLRNAAKNPALDKRIDHLEGDVTELKELVEELLSLTRMEQQKTLDAKPFSLANTLLELTRQLEHEFSERNLSVDLAPGLDRNGNDIIGDQRLVMRAVSNLLRNAAKYSNSQVKLSVEEPAQDMVIIRVEDDGPGVPIAERARIFEAFYRVDSSRDKNTGGLGLGLAIAKKAIHLNGGYLSVGESRLGGAAFTIRLPWSGSTANSASLPEPGRN